MSLVEKRYAEALINVAAENNAITDYQDELQSITDVYNKEEDFKFFLLNPKINAETKKGTLSSGLNGVLRKDVLNFLLVLLDKGRISLLPGIMKEFVSLADKFRSILNITIVSAAPIDENQVNRIKEKYRTAYNASAAKAEVNIDASLIGGVKVIIGDKVIDGTIKGKLEGLTKAIVNG